MIGGIILGVLILLIVGFVGGSSMGSGKFSGRDSTETAKVVRRITDTDMDGGIMDTGTSMGVSDPETAGLPGGRTGIDKKDLLLQEILKFKGRKCRIRLLFMREYGKIYKLDYNCFFGSRLERKMRGR